MRILAFTDFLFPSYLGGSARFASDLNEGLKLIGHSVSEISRPASGKYAGKSKKSNKQSWKTNFSIFFNCDYVLSHHSIFAFFPALFYPHKLIYFYHGPFAEEYLIKKGKRSFGYYFRQWLERFVLSRSTKIIVVSQYMADKILYYKDKVINLGPIQKVNNGAREIIFHSKKKRQYNCLTVRRLTPRTGVTELLELVASSERLNLTVVGAGELRDGLISKFGEQSKFHSNISDEKLKKMYRECDVVILPSLDLEGFGLIVLEALAAGKPILATKTSGGAFDFLSELGVTTFIDIHSDTTSEIEEKIGLVSVEFNNQKIIRELKSAFKRVTIPRMLDD